MNERKVTYLQGSEQVSFNGAFPFQSSHTVSLSDLCSAASQPLSSFFVQSFPPKRILESVL